MLMTPHDIVEIIKSKKVIVASAAERLFLSITIQHGDWQYFAFVEYRKCHSLIRAP